jgi:hypothetical protein
VIVTLADLTVWATHAAGLRDLAVLPAERPVPWILSLPDLMIVCDLLRSGQFVHYLTRRQRLERHGKIDAHDEIDWVANYLLEGLYFDRYFEGDEPPGRFRLLSYTDPVDAWYLTKDHEDIPTAPKPEQAIPDGLRLLLRRLETERPTHWVTASLALLDGDHFVRQAWSDFVLEVRDKLQRTGWTNCTQAIGDWLSITMFLDHRVPSPVARRRARAYVEEKKQERPAYVWVLLSEGSSGALSIDIDPDPGLTALLQRLLEPPPGL